MCVKCVCCVCMWMCIWRQEVYVICCPLLLFALLLFFETEFLTKHRTQWSHQLDWPENSEDLAVSIPPSMRIITLATVPRFYFRYCESKFSFSCLHSRYIYWLSYHHRTPCCRVHCVCVCTHRGVCAVCALCIQCMCSVCTMYTVYVQCALCAVCVVCAVCVHCALCA